MWQHSSYTIYIIISIDYIIMGKCLSCRLICGSLLSHFVCGLFYISFCGIIRCTEMMAAAGEMRIEFIF